jgi:pilus assembly protein CpaB
VVLVVSAVFAAAVAGLFYRFAGAKSRPAAAVITRPVVVAAVDLPVGAMIRPSDLKLVSMPQTFLPRNSFSRVEDVQSRAVMGKIFQDEPILQERLAAAGSPSGLAPMIQAGHRAVGVRVNDVISVAGFVQPGMRVDVVLTGHPPGSQNSVSRTVLQNILVLSAGPILQPEPKGQAINAAVVTLSVDPDQAEILILASAEGKVQLVLRNSTDSGINPPKGTQLSSLYGVAEQAESPPPEPRPAREKKPAEPIRSKPIRKEPIPALAAVELPRTIEMIRGSKKTLEPVSRGAQ